MTSRRISANVELDILSEASSYAACVDEEALLLWVGSQWHELEKK